MFPGKTRRPLQTQPDSVTSVRNRIPGQILAGMEACINAAFNGSVSQMEIAMGPDANNIRKVRFIVMPENFGEVVDKEDGSGKIRLIGVPNDLGAKIMEVDRECAGSPEIQ